MPSRYFSSCFRFSKLNSLFQCYVFVLSVAIVPKVSVAVAVKEVWVPAKWTEISMRVILFVTSSHYICSLEMSTCALALFFFCSWIFSSLCFFWQWILVFPPWTKSNILEECLFFFLLMILWFYDSRILLILLAYNNILGFLLLRFLSVFQSVVSHSLIIRRGA